MTNNITKELKEFEEWCVNTYHQGKIRSPMHLSGGNEEQLINIFKEIKSQDWVFTTYRSHYHALLKGVPEKRLKDWILDNKSIHFMDSEYKICSSAIVGGTLSHAVGVAMAIKYNAEINKVIKVDLSFQDESKGIIGRRAEDDHVWVFCGDMAASLGVFNDCFSYSINNDLPITFVIEDNGLSTDTPTHEAWGLNKEELSNWLRNLAKSSKAKYYGYNRIYPHYGTGKRINFEEKT